MRLTSGVLVVVAIGTDWCTFLLAVLTVADGIGASEMELLRLLSRVDIPSITTKYSIDF